MIFRKSCLLIWMETSLLKKECSLTNTLSLVSSVIETLAEMKKTTEYVRDLGDIEPPAWLTQKIMTKIRSEAGKEKSIWQKLFYPLHIKLPVEAAVAVLLAVTTIYIFKTMQPEMKLAKAPVEEMTSRMPLKETKSTDKDLMSRKD